MPTQKKAVRIKWEGQEVQCYYDSATLESTKIKFYESFSKSESTYRVGDFALVNISSGSKSGLICVLKCLYEDKAVKKAIVVPYEFAINFDKSFSALNVNYDETNEVVLNATKECVINLKDITGKRRVIIGTTNDSVSDVIDACNLNRKIYFLCRYQYTQNLNLTPIVDGDIRNNISFIENIEDTEIESDVENNTPFQKTTNLNMTPLVKKNVSKSMDVEEDCFIPQLAQVKRNLNKSFNDSSQDEGSFLNYSIVEQTQDESLKIKLRISNGNILTSIPTTQPVVLLDKIEKPITNSKEDSIYELKSPIFHSLFNNDTKKRTKRVSYQNVETPEKAKLCDLSNMVENLRIRDESPVNVSPRKLRRLSRPCYQEDNLTIGLITKSFTTNERRKSVRNKNKTSYQDIYFEISDDEIEKQSSSKNKKNSKTTSSKRKTLERKDSYIEVSEDKIEKENCEQNKKTCHDSDSESNFGKRKSLRTRSYFEINDDEIEKQNYRQNHESDSESNLVNRKSLRSRNKKAYFEVSDDEIETLDSKQNKKYTEDSESSSGKRKSHRRNTVSSETQLTPSIAAISLVKSRRQSTVTESSVSTPRSTKSLKTPLKMIREGTLTPSIDQRRKSVMKTNTPLVLARNNLHVSYVPKVLPCRDKEYADIYNFIEGKLSDKCGGCMYISGVPGTGKTATVTIVIDNLMKAWKEEGNPAFNYVNVNGMRMTEPRQCYVEILKQLTGKRMPWEQALSILEEKFTTKSSKKVVPTVLLVDELDILCTKRQDVVYNLLDWPTKTNAQLIVVTIANTMDLPERLLMSRVTSRLGLTRLTFQAYSHKQLQEIVVNRLTGNDSFKSDAIQFVARKVASVSGDARRALDICRRSAEIAEMEGPNTLVSMHHVNIALEAMITQPKVKAITHCSKLEKFIMKSVIAEVERTGVEETIFGDVYAMLTSLSALEGFKMVSVSLMASAVYRLSSCRLLLADQKCVDFNQRIILNVSADDVYYALKKD